MSVQVTIPLDALSDPRVNSALGQLMNALGKAPLSPSVSIPAPVVHQAARPAAPVSGPVDADYRARWAEFLEVLPDRSRQFLELVEARQLLTIAEAMATLDVDVGKAMGGITGSIARWAPEHQVTVPFEAVKGPDGRRAWRWIGLNRRPAPPIPVRARRRNRRKQKRTASASDRGDRGSSEPSQAERLAALKAGLPEDSLRFLNLLEARGELKQAEVLSHFGLARAQGLRRILSPIAPVAERHGLGEIFETVVSSLGERGWRWGLSSGVPQPAAPSRKGNEVGRGVLVRKRNQG